MTNSINRLLLAFIFVIIGNSVDAQCDGNRYLNQVFNEFNVTTDISYGSNLDYLGNDTELFLDIYEPEGDTFTERPLIIMVHGGSFIGGSKDGDDVVPLCQDFAKMGYVVASIQYRLGISLDLEIEQNATEAVVRGYHDGKAAVRWFRKDVAENGNTYSINQDQIYMAGVSAGGFVALHNAYMDEVSEIPTIVDQEGFGLGGGLEGNSGNDGYSSELAGIVNIAGAIADTSYIQPGDIPACLFHGTGDTVVPFDSDILTLFGVFEVVDVDGSNSIDQKLTELEIDHCFEIYEMQGHVPHVDNAAYYDTTRAIMSNFLAHLTCPEIALDCEYREVVLGLEDDLVLSQLNVYPNPSNGTFTITGLPEEKTKVRITNILGEVVLEQTSRRSTLEVTLNEENAGIYFVQCEINGELITERLVIE